MGSDIQADPTVFFASGIFVGAFVAVVIALAVCLVVGGWALTWASRYESFHASRQNGKIKVEAELHDTRPAKTQRPKGRLKPPGNGQRHVPQSELS